MSFQQQYSQKKIRPEYPESEMESESRLQWGSQKLEPKIGIPNLATSLDHVRAFIHNIDPTGVLFLPTAVCCAEHLLGLWQKASSTTCQRAFLPLSKHKRHAFWWYNYPFGRANVRMQDMINVDEVGFKIENTNPRLGKTVSWLHCYLEGEYNWDKKVVCMMAISADLHDIS
jgi:hypothetical protein